MKQTASRIQPPPGMVILSAVMASLREAIAELKDPYALHGPVALELLADKSKSFDAFDQ